MTPQESIAYIENCGWSTTRLGLERTHELLFHLGDPQRSLRFIHVAGSNGKGSTCAMLDAILRAEGYRVGLYTSPYIQDFCERIRINGENIPDDALAALTEKVRTIAEEMADHPSQFELVTAIAMEYFARQHCDIVVLEVGMGGALDSTNAIDAPDLAVITNVGLEHTEYLGTTLEAIADTKAGIIKHGCDCVLYDGAPEVTAVIRRHCAEKAVPLLCENASEIRPLATDWQGQTFRYRGETYQLALLGRHQLRNAHVVLQSVAALRRRGWHISDEAVHMGLATVRWPARLEVLHRTPLCLLDGGHNPQCAQALAESLSTLMPDQKAVFLCGVLADKDYPRIFDAIAPHASVFYCVEPDSPRALSAEALTEYLTGRGLQAVCCDSIESGLQAALQATTQGGSLVAFGSLYLAGRVRTLFPDVLRRRIRIEKTTARNALPDEDRRRCSDAIWQQITRLPAYQCAKTVLLYRASDGEVTLPTLAPDGKRFAYPCCEKGGHMEALLPQNDRWITGYGHILEPDPTTSQPVAPEKIDLVICPCTAFDENCRRLGTGGGYYDRYLPRCTRAAVIAVAFEAQKVPSIPMAPWDIPMDTVVTETAVYTRKTD